MLYLRSDTAPDSKFAAESLKIFCPKPNFKINAEICIVENATEYSASNLSSYKYKYNIRLAPKALAKECEVNISNVLFKRSTYSSLRGVAGL